MGNAAELLIAFVALQQGLISLVKASITGSIVGNLLLILGMGLLLGGWRHGRLRFDPREAGHHSSMMLIALAALVLPAFFVPFVPDRRGLAEVSDGFAIILLVVYGAYLFFSTRPEGQIVAAQQIQAPDEHARPPWTPPIALGVLLGATVGTGVLAEALVGTVETVSHTLGLSEFFVGVIVVPLVGNVAEHLSAVQLAAKGKVDVGLAIAAGSSTQIALFVAPLLVLASCA
jgi:Ca2+:H+ antiporter